MKSKCRQNPISLAISDPWSQSAGDYKVALNLKEGLGQKKKKRGERKKRKERKKTVEGQGYFQMGFCLTSSVKVECFD